MATIIPFSPVKTPEPPAEVESQFISMAFCKGFKFDPDKVNDPAFLKACLTALSLKSKDDPDLCSMHPVAINPAFAIFNEKRQIIGVVFAQESFGPIQG